MYGLERAISRTVGVLKAPRSDSIPVTAKRPASRIAPSFQATPVLWNCSGQPTGVAQIVKRNLATQQDEVIYTPDESAPNFDYFNSLEISPDGRWLAASGDVGIPLIVISADGGQPRPLLKVPESEFLRVVGWTPDGREVLFTRNQALAD